MSTDDTPIMTTDRLAVFLGGSGDSFTGLLLTLIAKADPRNRERLRLAFPREVNTWETWQATSPAPTAGQLGDLMARTICPRCGTRGCLEDRALDWDF